MSSRYYLLWKIIILLQFVLGWSKIGFFIEKKENLKKIVKKRRKQI